MDRSSPVCKKPGSTIVEQPQNVRLWRLWQCHHLQYTISSKDSVCKGMPVTFGASSGTAFKTGMILSWKSLSANASYWVIHNWRLKLHHVLKITPVFTRSLFEMDWGNWKTLLWSDKSKFSILSGKHGHRVFQTKGQRDHVACFRCSIQKPASLMYDGALMPMELAACTSEKTQCYQC